MNPVTGDMVALVSGWISDMTGKTLRADHVQTLLGVLRDRFKVQVAADNQSALILKRLDRLGEAMKALGPTPAAPPALDAAIAEFTTALPDWWWQVGRDSDNSKPSALCGPMSTLKSETRQAEDISVTAGTHADALRIAMRQALARVRSEDKFETDARPFEVGDIVECISAEWTSSELKRGEKYVIKRVTDDGHLVAVGAVATFWWEAARFRKVKSSPDPVAPEPTSLEPFTYAQACVLAKLGLRMKPAAWPNREDFWLSPNGKRMISGGGDDGRGFAMFQVHTKEPWVMLPVQPL